MLNTSPEDRTFDWVKREVLVAESLHAKVLEDIDPEDEDMIELVCTPKDYWVMRNLYKPWWDKYVETKCDNFKEKHAETLHELEKEKEENIKKLQMTEDEKIDYFLAKDKEREEKLARGESVYMGPPEEFYADQKAIRGFFNSTFAVYFGLMSKIIELLDSEEFDFIEIDLEEELLSESMINTLEPYQNKHFASKANEKKD